MTQVTFSYLKNGLVFHIGASQCVRILAMTPKEGSLDPMITYRSFDGGSEETLSMSEFMTTFAGAELGLPEFAGNVYQIAGGVRATVLHATPQDDIADVMLIVGLDNGAQPIGVLASAFLATRPERITTH